MLKNLKQEWKEAFEGYLLDRHSVDGFGNEYYIFSHIDGEDVVIEEGFKTYDSARKRMLQICNNTPRIKGYAKEMANQYIKYQKSLGVQFS